METKRCPFCAEEIAVDAKKCKHCGEYLDPELRQQRQGNDEDGGRSPWTIVAWLLVIVLIIVIAGAFGC